MLILRPPEADARNTTGKGAGAFRNDNRRCLLAAWIPATRAARLDPMQTIRQE
jgi:hypothetical protein